LGGRRRAQTLYDSGNGEITQVELAKLDYGLSEAKRFCFMAQDGATLALSALRHVMGRPGDSALQLRDSSMPPAPDRCAAETLPPLHLVHRAKQLRPEWEQLRQGRLAARAWEKAERSANYPVLFLAGQLRYGHAPTRDTDQNPWHFDNYNTVTGGLAVGLKFDLDPMLVAARAQEARAKLTQVDALAAQATTGIDVQVRRAHADLLRARRSQQISQMGLVATRQ
jgi:outer membrane protein TolC